MRIAVLGTGMVGQAIAGRCAELGHDVSVGTREVAAALGRHDRDGMGNPGFGDWAATHPQIAVASFADAAAAAEIIVNATSGGASLAALGEAGADNLAGKVLVDVANPLDFSAGMPPSLSVKDTDSLAEQIQRAFPTSRVVKTLNTMNAEVMVHPELVADGHHSTFVAGDDADAKTTVTTLLTDFGHRDVIDLGDLSAARGTEMLLPLWLRLFGVLGTPAFQFAVVR